jgi:hypothetical protein
MGLAAGRKRGECSTRGSKLRGERAMNNRMHAHTKTAFLWGPGNELDPAGGSILELIKTYTVYTRQKFEGKKN